MTDFTGASEQMAILVVSCDSYHDLWVPFFRLFDQYYPGCPFETYLLSNRLGCEKESVHTIAVGEDVSWSDNLSRALGQIPQPYVLLFLDDLFLTAPVEAERIEGAIAWLSSMDGNYLRLNPTPGPPRAINRDVGVIPKGALYRASVVLSVWKRDTLLQLLRPAESAWDFEVKGTERSDALDGFYASRDWLLPHVNAVIKGKYRRSVAARVEAMGAGSRRRVMSPGDELRFALNRLRSSVLKLVPSAYRRTAKRLLGGNEGRYHVGK